MEKDIKVKEQTREKVWLGDKRFRRVTLEVLVPETEMFLADSLTESGAISPLGEACKEALTECSEAYLDFASEFLRDGEKMLRLLSLPEEEYQAELKKRSLS